ncbi:MAG: hypothetical protein WDN69_14635 [Aliidongia sp.]
MAIILIGGGFMALPAAAQKIVTLGSGFSLPAGVAVDGHGNVFVADTFNNTVKEIPAGGGAVMTLSSGLFNPYGVAVDGQGDVFFSNTDNNTVMEIPAGGGAVVTLGSGFFNPYGVALDGQGNVFVADFANSLVKKIVLAAPVPALGAWGLLFCAALLGAAGLWAMERRPA